MCPMTGTSATYRAEKYFLKVKMPPSNTVRLKMIIGIVCTYPKIPPG
jgi:hypothetical protein